MKKHLIASVLGLGLGIAAVLGAPGCGKSGQSDNCIGCQSLSCKDNQLDSWCLIDITDPKVPCHFEQSFGYCLTVPDAGFAPNTNVNSWVWQIMSYLVKPMIADKWGTSVGYDILECKVAASNPYFGQYHGNSYKIPLGKISLGTPDGGFRVEDEASCEACASGQCNLTSCIADANCSCWVSCSFTDPSLASCPGTCGPFGGVTTALVSCLDTTCGEACGVANSNMATCGSNVTDPGTGAGGSTGTGTCTLQQGGQDCAVDTDCCSGQCIAGYPSGTCA